MWRSLSPVVFDRWSPYFVPDSGSPGGGAGGEGHRDDDDEITVIGKVDASTIALQLDRAKRAKRDADNEAKNLRDRLRAAEEKLGPLTGEGVVVLRGDDAAAYREYATLGKPAEIKTRLEERDRLAQEVTTAKRDGTLRDAAQRYGYDHEALRAHTGDLPLTAYEVEEEGQKVTKYRIGEGDAQADIAEWVGKQPAYVGRALAVTTGGQGQQSGGVRYPAQGSGEHRPVNVAESYVTSTYKGPPKRG